VRLRTVVAAFLLAAAAPAAVTTAAAAVFTLTEAQKRQALEYGRQSAPRENFDAEWRVQNGAGETLVVLTPFHRLVIASRHATFRDEPLRPNEPDRLLREQKDRLVVSLELRGRREDFTRLYVPELEVGDRRIRAAFVQNDRTPERLDDGVYLARCTYAFPLRELTGTQRVALIVRDADGRPASRFTIELSQMR
jgi:hypothetical protein